VPRPGTITSVQSQVHDPERVSIFIDGEFALGVARDVADALSLDKGREIDEAMIAEILAREELHKSTTIALNFLAYRPRSEGEIRSRLQRAGMPDATIEMTMAKLRDWHYVDDSDFARRWIENRIAHRPRGARLLSQELKQKGIAPLVMSEALDDADIDELGDALSIARTRWRQLADLDLPVRERRLSGFLARRGYGYDVIRSTLATLRDESGNDTDPELE
jgi:regulatory protein